MSIQSDVEMLFIKAMEIYGERNNLTSNEVISLFCNYQVYEKILIQHEYLHQVDFEEVMDYIEKVIKEDTHQLVLYHGSCCLFDVIDLSKSHNRRDFGRGFYATLLEKQAKKWAYRLSLREKTPTYYVYQYVFDESRSLKVKRFSSLDQEWLEFIKENRAKGGLQHDFDVVIGPVADDNTMETVQLYISGILEANEAVKRLRHSQINNQVSFHTEEALHCLRFVRRDQYE